MALHHTAVRIAIVTKNSVYRESLSKKRTFRNLVPFSLSVLVEQRDSEWKDLCGTLYSGVLRKVDTSGRLLKSYKNITLFL